MSTIKNIAKALFGKDYAVIWKQFALDIDGKYSISPGGEDQVIYTYRNLQITIDQYVTYTAVGSSSHESIYLRGRIQFVSGDQMIFRLTEQGFFENIGKLFGAQDVIVGDDSFDEKFMVKGNDEMKIQILFSNPLLQKKLEQSNLIRLELTNKEGLFFEQIEEGKHMLYFASKREVKSLTDLYNCRDLFALMVDELIKTGSIPKNKE